MKTYKDVPRPKGSVQCVCSHCGEIYGSNSAGQCAILCSDCKKASDRKQMDAENTKIFKASGLTFRCQYCD